MASSRRSHPQFCLFSSDHKIALELVLTGEPVTAETRLGIGMVNRLVPEAQLRTSGERISVGRISGHSDPCADHGQESHSRRHGLGRFVKASSIR